MESPINFSMFPVPVRRMNLYQKRGIFLNLLICLVLISLSSIFISYDLDRKISALFYSSVEGWIFADKEPWNWMHRYGHIPGALFALLSLLIYIASFFKSELARLRRYLLVIILTTGIGGGVIVNIILKDNWGRPRPHQIKEFGGYWEYRDINSPGVIGKGRSFSCGHCTMGYIFLTTLFFYETSKGVAITGGLIGLLWGALMSLARVGQGGHFASDTLWSLGIILIVANTLYNLLLFPPPFKKPDKESEEKREGLVALLGFSTLGTAALFAIFLSPVFGEHRETLTLNPGTEELHIKLNFERHKLKILNSDESLPAISGYLSARGSSSVKIAHRVQQVSREKITCVEYSLDVDGPLASPELNVTVSLPTNITFHEITTGSCELE